MIENLKITPMIILGILIASIASPPIVADDTEIFAAGGNTISLSAQPNVLFIIDTSGSMDTEIITQVPYDPLTKYNGCYDSNAVYFNTSTNGETPACGSKNWFAKSVNYCNASLQKLDTLGIYADEMQSWNSSLKSWVDLSGSKKAQTRPTECRGDRGIHGDGVNNSLVFAAEGPAGPWASTANNEPFWNTKYTLYDGNWLNWNKSDPTVKKTRLEAVQDVALLLADNFDSINIGLQRFNHEEGGGIIDAVQDIAVNRQDFKGNVISLQAGGYTPLSEVYYEAGQYFMGRAVDYGNIEPHKSVPQTRTDLNSSSNTYLSPADSSCQNNYIVFLTDGEPTRDSSADSKVKQWPGWADKVGSCDGSGDGHCLDDMADYLFHTDVSTKSGFQNVTTYTVGFFADFPLLAKTAKRGGGEYRVANDTAGLTLVLTEIFLDILDDATTFTAPAVPVNAFNRTRNLADAYVSVFEPSRRLHWPGNLKKYRLVQGEMYGQDNKPAVDESTGFFKSDAHSFWSAAPDGDRVVEGGAANEIPAPSSRKVYTNLVSGNLTVSANRFEIANNGITAAQIGAPDSQRNLVIAWALGLDVFDSDEDGDFLDTRNVMGDPLHVRPATVIYGGTALAPDATVFVSTNDGYFHAVDPDTGVELWSFIPRGLLGRLYDLYLNNVTSGSKGYGLDGNIEVFIKNDDGMPGISGNEEVILLFGMRRGGSSVFALNATDRSNPVLMWEINETDLPDIGQTWSTPAAAKVNIDGTDTLVAIFGGGYDTGQDSTAMRTDTKGNAIYMVDLETGKRIWSAGHPTVSVGSHDLLLPSMDYSVPAPVKVLDLSLDGRADRMYVGDMGGQLLRFDIVNGNSAAQLVEGGVLASVGAAGTASPTASSLRRFYSSPDVASVITKDKTYLSINIGSGYRAHPLWSAIEDEFYSIRDFDFFNVIKTADYGTPTKRSDLIDITNDVDPIMAPTDPGWRLTLGASEKVLSESFTFNGQVFFTSFTPNSNANTTCVAGPGTNRLYRVDVRDGKPVVNFDEAADSEELTEEDRRTDLDQGGIAPEPVFVFPEDLKGKPAVCIGVECLDPDFDGNAVRTYWFQDETQ